MRKEHRSEMATEGTAWTVEASVVDGHVSVEVVGAAQADGVIGVQLHIDGSQLHLATLQDITQELQTVLFGITQPHRSGADRLDAIRRELPRSYQPWSEDEEERLLERWDAGEPVALIAEALERTKGGVRSRLVKLGRIKEAG